MWLLNTATLELKDFIGASVPPYAILSHTWGEDEVTFRDMRKDREAAKTKAGYTKVQKCCQKALLDGHQYIWIDTCCIDKRSSAELSEAINSMYRWYSESLVCYAYLEDVLGDGLSTIEIDEALSSSRWFTRGWTLQELTAPCYIQFLARDWTIIGVKLTTGFSYLGVAIQPPTAKINVEIFREKLTDITGVPARVLSGALDIQLVPTARKMAWAAKRVTTREEDLAYALIGLFGVSMPILYGEGLEKAFRRLQLEIIQTNTDQSIFAWRAERRSSGLLAESPRDFADSGLDFVWRTTTLQPYSMTNLGLALNLPIVRRRDRDRNYYVAFLRCCK
jgi:Heterokaryon incompatibility protein (HET)